MSPARQHRRYPWDELWAWAEGRGITMTDLARRIGSDRRDLYRWREAGSVPETAADRVAVKLGTVPGLIWSEWDAHGLEAAERAEAERRARIAGQKRRYRQRNPDYAERQRAKVERWKAANPGRVKRYHAEYQREWRRRQDDEYREARAEYQRKYRAQRNGLVAPRDSAPSPANPQRRPPSHPPHTEGRTI